MWPQVHYLHDYMLLLLLLLLLLLAFNMHRPALAPALQAPILATSIGEWLLELATASCLLAMRSDSAAPRPSGPLPGLPHDPLGCIAELLPVRDR